MLSTSQSPDSTCLLLYISEYRLPSARYHGLWLRQNPVQWIPRSNGTCIVLANQRTPRRDVKMARQKPPVLAYYGAGPFNFTNSITNVPGLKDGKICTLYIDTSVFPLHRVLLKSRSIPNPKLRVRALPRQIPHFCAEVSRHGKTCQLPRAPS